MLTQPTRQKTCCGILRKDSEERSDHELTLLSAVMREVPQFQQLDSATLKAICRQMEFKRFAKGDVIVQEGDLGNEFYVLITGAVSIYTNRPEEQSGQESNRKLPQRCVDYTVAEVREWKTADVKAKSRTVRALNRRISYTVDWDAMEKKGGQGAGIEHQEDRSDRRRVSVAQGTQQFHARGSAFTDSESEEEAEDLALPKSARTMPGRVTRRLSSEKEGGLEEKSPRRGPQLRTAALCPGSSFGELSLLGAKLPRQSTAKCEEKCKVAVLRREVYQQILTSTESSRRNEWLRFAETAPVLRHLDESLQVLCEPLVKIQQVSRGEKVVRLGDPVQVFFLAEGVFAVSVVPGDSESSQAVTSALMVPPSCFGLSAHSRNETHFHETTLTSCSASGKVYILQTKHLWMMLSNHQQEALTRAASYERTFQLSHAAVMQEMSQPLSKTRHQLYSPAPRLAALRHQLREQADGAISGEEGEALRRTLAKSWSVECLQPPAPLTSRKERLPRTQPDSSVAPEDVPKLRLHSSLLSLWSPAILEERHQLFLGQHHGVFHGYGPPVQANRFVTQFFKVKSGPWSHAIRTSSASEPLLRVAARPRQADGGEEEELCEAFEDDGGMSPLLDAKIKETMRQRRRAEEWRQRAEKAAATLQRVVRHFLRKRKKQNIAATCIQRAFRARKEHGDTPSRPSERSVPATPSATSDAEGPSEAGPDEVALSNPKGEEREADEAPPRHGSILQLDLDTVPKLQDLKKALGRASNRRSLRLSRMPHESEEPSESDRNVVKFRQSAEVPQLFVPLDLIEKHQLLMETQVLEEWPNTQQLSTLKRLRRKWEKLQRKPPANTEVVPVEPVPSAPNPPDLGALKLPALPSPRGTMVFSARLSAVHADPAVDWNRGVRDFEKDEIDLAEIYRPKPCPPRFRSTLRRYG